MAVVLIVILSLLASLLLGIWIGRFCGMNERESDWYGDDRWGE